MTTRGNRLARCNVYGCHATAVEVRTFTGFEFNVCANHSPLLPLTGEGWRLHGTLRGELVLWHPLHAPYDADQADLRH